MQVGALYPQGSYSFSQLSIDTEHTGLDNSSFDLQICWH